MSESPTTESSLPEPGLPEPGPAHSNTRDSHRLQRLWKGTLYTVIAAGYLTLVGLPLIYVGWRPACLLAFLVILGQFLRFIAGDVDRVGWEMAQRPAGAEPDQQYQRWLLTVLFVLVQATNVGLVGVTGVFAGALWAAVALAGLLGVEVLFAAIRRINREINFESASYGAPEGPVQCGHLHNAPNQVLEQRLATLEAMASRGEISRDAFETARDKARIDHVLKHS